MRIVVFFYLALVACAGATHDEKSEPMLPPAAVPLGEEELTAAEECAESLLLFAEDSDSEVLNDFLRHCAREMGFPQLGDLPEERRWLVLAERSDLVCSKAAGHKAGVENGKANLATLVEECGADYFGLPADAKDIITFQWFLAQRTAARLAQWQSKLGQGHAKLLGDLRKAQQQYSALVPLPSEVAGHYRLPGEGVDSNHSNSTTYVLLAPGATFVGTTPRMRLTPNGAELVTPAGVRFPGERSSAVAADVEALLETIGEPELLGGPVYEDDFDDQEYSEYGLPSPPRDSVAAKQAYVQELKGKDPTSHLSPEQKQRAKELATENARKAGILYLSKNQYAISDEAPLIVADVSASAARVLKVAQDLAKHGSYLATRGESDWGMAYASVLGFSPRPTDRPIIALDAALEISAGHLTLRRKGDSQAHKMLLAEALRDNSPMQKLLRASKGEVHRLVLVAADDSASSGDLARLLLRCATLDFRFAFAGTLEEARAFGNNYPAFTGKSAGD